MFDLGFYWKDHLNSADWKAVREMLINGRVFTILFFFFYFLSYHEHVYSNISWILLCGRKTYVTTLNLNWVIVILFSAPQFQVTDYTIMIFVYRDMFGLVKRQEIEIQYGKCVVNGQVSSNICWIDEFWVYVSWSISALLTSGYRASDSDSCDQENKDKSRP